MPEITEDGANRALVRMLGSFEAKSLIISRVKKAIEGNGGKQVPWEDIAEIIKEVAQEVSEAGDWEEVARYLVDGPDESNIDMGKGPVG